MTLARRRKRKTGGLLVTNMTLRSKHETENMVASKEVEYQACDECSLSKSANWLYKQRLTLIDGWATKTVMDVKLYGMTNTDTPCFQNISTYVVIDHTKSGCTVRFLVKLNTSRMNAGISGRISTKSYCGSQYLLTVTVGQRRKGRVKSLRNKKTFKGYYHEYISWVKCQTMMKMRRSHIDNSAN